MAVLVVGATLLVISEPVAARATGPAPTPAVAPTVAGGPAGTVANYGLAVREPQAITQGPDGNLWFASYANDAIGRVTTAGVVTMFSDPSITQPWAIVSGPDGNLWFTNSGGNSIGRMTPAGVVTHHTHASIQSPRGIAVGSNGAIWFANHAGGSLGSIDPGSLAVASFADAAITAPSALVSGPDGNLWFTTAPADQIGRMTTAGVLTTFTDAALSNPRQLAAGPDGNVWFTSSANQVGKVTPVGVVTAYTSPDIVDPQSITSGPGGQLWFTNSDSNTIGTITTAGVVGVHADASIAQPWGITSGPDGGVWFTNRGQDTIGRMDPSTFAVASHAGSGLFDPVGIVAGPDGNTWFTNYAAGSIGRITPTGVISLFSGDGVLGPTGITVGPDGNLWFTNLVGDSIGRITTAGVITIYRDFSIDGPWGITVGPDNNLWFTNAFNSTIGRIVPGTGAITRYVNAAVNVPTGIVTGVDGHLWFTNTSGHSIGRMDPTSHAVVAFTAPSVNGPQAIVAAPDGDLWFTNTLGNSIGRITTAGTISSFTHAGIVKPLGLAVGPDGNVWLASSGVAKVVRITPQGTVTEFPTGAAVPRMITSGPDDALWFSNANSSIGSITAGDPEPGLTYHPMAPVRILDSRGTTGGWNAELAAGTPKALTVRGVAGVPLDAQAVIVNVTATQSTAPSFLTVYPSGGAVPNASNLNFAANQTIPNLVSVKIGDGGNISFATAAGATHVVADIVGWFGAVGGNRFDAVDPVRILDSRTTTGGWGAPLVAGTPRSLQVTGVAGVPATASAVEVNVTATEGSAPSFLTLYPTGGSTPNASNVNFAAGETIPNHAVVQLGTGGALTIANAIGSVEVVVDVTGYFEVGAGTVFHPMAPTRVLDSRGVNGGWNAKLGTTPRSLALAGYRGIDGSAAAVVGNATVTGATAPSFLTVFPAGGSAPNVSHLNFAAGQTIPNLVTAKLGTGAASFRNATGSVDVVFDVVGYFAST